MASTSTNKQPLLVDRPLRVAVDLSERTVEGTSNGIDIGGANSAALVIDCTQNDGAIIDDIISTSRDLPAQLSLGYEIYMWLSVANDYLRNNQAYFIGGFSSGASPTEIERFGGNCNILRPVPKVGSVNQEGDPVEGTYYTALYVPKGMALWAAIKLQTDVWADDDGNRAPLLHVQGGYF